jgi:hypothetical protein
MSTFSRLPPSSVDVSPVPTRRSWRESPAAPGGTPARERRFAVMGYFRDPLVLLLLATAAAIAFFVVATSG